MEKELGQNKPEITTYAKNVFKPTDSVLDEIHQRSVKAGMPEIQVGPMDGLHLEVIAKAIGAKKAVEIGTLGGYSGVCLCRGMGPDCELYTFEISDKNAAVAAESFKKAGVEKNVKIHVGPALLNLPLIKKFGPFDLVFIDADKESYPAYLAWATENLRIGGIVLGDNTFAWGTIGDEKENSPSVNALRQFNKECAQNGRFRSTIIPTAEGLTLAVKIK